ncbi:MAG TPA: hypothetical protein VL598_03730 [Trinickia sp.]|jgi:hypothetical protein|uniref:hypothetical protein n=1 Tax=Trinickia sp. TaxID=2571163 RepID=UPI002CF1C310|nr:hypothetical protein [Trinickia sp.]HTI16753.1 hypothetical protein [Trinickia sp.]
MHVEILGPYRLEVTARQHIDNGGWTAFAAVHNAEDDGDTKTDLLPDRIVDDAVFESKAAAIAAARRAAIELVSAAGGQVSDH